MLNVDFHNITIHYMPLVQGPKIKDIFFIVIQDNSSTAIAVAVRTK